MMFEIDMYELVSQKQASTIARLDAPQQVIRDDKFAERIDDYVHKNHLTYYILSNTWLLLIKSYAPMASARVYDRILSTGLIPIIKEFNECADDIVHTDCTGVDSTMYPLQSYMLREIRISGRPNTMMLYPEYNIGRDPMATLLCLLRYPKRFSPSDNSAIQAASIKDFLTYEARTKRLQRSQSGRYTHDFGYSRYVLDWAREIIHDMYDWDRLCDQIEQMDISDIMFSSGAGFDSKASIGSKLMVIWKKHPEYFYRPFGAYVLPMQTPDCEGDARLAAIQAVPKSYKASRIIAMEDTYRLAYCKRVEEFFRAQDKITGCLNLEDQSINQLLAQEGSRTGEYATLDASHASDLISLSCFKAIFPSRYVNLILPFLSTHYSVNGKIYRKEMLSTSGHTLTFRHESIVYKAIGLVASQIGTLFRGEEPSTAFSWAYGDDTIVKSVDAQLTIECFEAIGLIINESKSFTTQSPGYRESCGEEYCRGEVMTSVYYPRFPVLGTLEPIKLQADRLFNDSYRGKIDDSTTMLIDLQKKLFPLSVEAARFVWCIVKQAHPKMTTSPYGYTCPDLWDIDDCGIVRKPHAFHLATVNVYRRLRICGRDVNVLYQSRPEWVDNGCVEDDELVRYAKYDTYHYASYIAYDGKKSYTELEIRIYEMYKYMYFLKNGPSYNSSLDRLLGVTQPFPPISTFYGKRRMAWRLQLIDLTK